MARASTRPTSVSSKPQLVRVDDLSLGLELRLASSLLKQGQASLLRNWSLREPGSLVTYPGWLERSDSSLGARRPQGGQRVYLDAATFTLVADNGLVYKPSDGFVWGVSVQGGRDTVNQIFFPHDRDLVAVLDGVTAPVKTTDGSTWSSFGLAAPSVAPTASAVAGGSLVVGNTYEVSYSYEDTELAAEGNESARVSQATAGANLTVRAAVTASADPQVDAINVYVRDVTSGESVRRFYATYANATTTHDITSNSWQSGRAAPSDHDVPPATLGWAIVWKNRWWAVDRTVRNRIYFTQLFEPQSWPGLFYIDIPFERGDEIAAIVAQGDTLVVFGKASKPFLIIGQTSLDFEVRPSLGAQAGAVGPRACEVLENGVVHVSAEGVYIFDGSSDRLLSYNIDPGWRDLVEHTTGDDLEAMACVYHGLTKELRIATTRLFPWGTNGEWVLDLNRTRLQETPAWTQTDRAVGGYIHWNGNESVEGNRGRLFSWAMATAVVNEENVGFTANGGDMVCDVQLSTHSTGGFVASFIEGYLELQPAGGLFSVEAFVDGIGKGSYTVDIGAGLARYGTARYGTDRYGSIARLQKGWPLPMSAEGRTISVRARYAGKQSFKWFTYAVEAVPESRLTAMG
ncbi:MAG: hypothetical protein ABL982_00055 [Vicinamibacterales bacterium]